jgi:hypothetical protein
MISSLAGLPGRATEPGLRCGSSRRQSAACGSADWSARISSVLLAVRGSIASTWPMVEETVVPTGIADVTLGARLTEAARPSGSGEGRTARTSAPASNADWSSADCRQLWCWASASVPVPTASTISSIEALCLAARRLISQEGMATPSRRVRAASRSTALAATGSSRSGSTVAAASTTAGASASTGSTPTPADVRPRTE